MRLSLAALLTIVSVVPVHAESLEAQRRTLEALNAQEEVLAGQIGANRSQLARLLSALQLFSRDPPPPLLVSPRDAKDAVRAMILARAIAPQLEARARALSVQAQALAVLRRQAAEASGDLFAAESALEDREGRIDALTQDAALMAQPSVQPAPASGALDAQPAPAALLAPADGVVAARFGGRLQNGLRSRGFAYRTGAGAPVRSPAAAVVAYAGPLNGWGQVVILHAAGGCHIVLSGLGRVSVTAGQSVAPAYPLGVMPTSGHPSPELYFEVRMARGPVDPARLLQAGAAAADSTGAGRGVIFNADGLRLRRQGAD
ncbi:MAG: murein hydrolase activator EnvC family protein [Caulobacterales bacterium]